MELKQSEKTAQPGNNRNTCQIRYKGEKNSDTKWIPQTGYKLVCLRKCEKQNIVLQNQKVESVPFFFF